MFYKTGSISLLAEQLSAFSKLFSLKQAWQTHGEHGFMTWPPQVLFCVSNLLLSSLLLLHNAHQKCSKIEHSDYFTSFCSSTLQILPIKDDEGTWHWVLQFKM